LDRTRWINFIYRDFTHALALFFVSFEFKPTGSAPQPSAAVFDFSGRESGFSGRESGFSGRESGFSGRAAWNIAPEYEESASECGFSLWEIENLFSVTAEMFHGKGIFRPEIAISDAETGISGAEKGISGWIMQIPARGFESRLEMMISGSRNGAARRNLQFPARAGHFRTRISRNSHADSTVTTRLTQNPTSMQTLPHTLSEPPTLAEAQAVWIK
jgi:hypothetical protein